MTAAHVTNKSFSPFLSTFFVIMALLVSVFFKMEVVREGYELVRLSRMEKQEIDKGRRLQTEYSKLLRPERLDRIATQKLALTRAQKAQVVLMASDEWTVRQ